MLAALAECGLLNADGLIVHKMLEQQGKVRKPKEDNTISPDTAEPNCIEKLGAINLDELPSPTHDQSGLTHKKA